MIAQGGRTTQRVKKVARLSESREWHDSLSRASPTLTSPSSHLQETTGAGQSCSARKSYSQLPSWQLRQRNASQTAARLALERPAQHEASRVTDRS